MRNPVPEHFPRIQNPVRTDLRAKLAQFQEITTRWRVFPIQNQPQGLSHPFEPHPSRAFGDLLPDFDQSDLAVDQSRLAGGVLRPIHVRSDIQIRQPREPRLDFFMLSIQLRQLNIQAGVHARFFLRNLGQHFFNPVRRKLSERIQRGRKLTGKLLFAQAGLTALHRPAALRAVVVDVAFLSFSSHGMAALGTAHEALESEVVLALAALGLATIAHHGLRRIPQVLGHSRLVRSLVAFSAEVKCSVVERVLQHPLYLRGG